MLRRTSFKPAYMVKIQPIDIEWRTKSSGLGSAFILIIVVVKKDRRCDQVICQIHDDPDVGLPLSLYCCFNLLKKIAFFRFAIGGQGRLESLDFALVEPPSALLGPSTTAGNCMRR